jgi:hypothetical protein
MTCRHCKAAETNPDHASYASCCPGCGIRELAMNPLFRGLGVPGRPSEPYAKALARVVGHDLAGGHARVRAERARLEGLRVVL